MDLDRPKKRGLINLNEESMRVFTTTALRTMRKNEEKIRRLELELEQENEQRLHQIKLSIIIFITEQELCRPHAKVGTAKNMNGFQKPKTLALLD